MLSAHTQPCKKKKNTTHTAYREEEKIGVCVSNVNTNEQGCHTYPYTDNAYRDRD